MERYKGSSVQDKSSGILSSHTSFTPFILPWKKVSSSERQRQLSTTSTTMVDFYKDPRRTQNSTGPHKVPSTAIEGKAQQDSTINTLATQSTVDSLNVAEGRGRKETSPEVPTTGSASKLRDVHTKPSATEKRWFKSMVSWVEGSFSVFPSGLRKRLEDFCRQNNTSILPCASALWPDGMSIKEDAAGRRRQWVTVPEGLELEVSRFTYNMGRQLLVARCQSGGQWESGASLVLVRADDNMYKVWRGQRDINAIPTADIKVLCREGLISSVQRQTATHPQLPTADLVGESYSQRYPQQQAAQALAINNDQRKANKVLQAQLQLQQGPIETTPKTTGLVGTVVHPTFAPARVLQSTTPTAVVMPQLVSSGKQSTSCNDRARDGYESDDQSVSDVPYGWAGSQSEMDQDAQSLPPTSTVPSNGVSTGSGDVLSTTNHTRHRKPQQVPEEHEDGENLPRSVSPKRLNVLSESSLKPKFHRYTPVSQVGSQQLLGRAPPQWIPDLTGFKATQRHRLRPIRPWDGSIASFPPQLRAELESWCKQHKTHDLPCAKHKWNGGDTVEVAMSKKDTTKRKRTWTTESGAEELSVGRFRYGTEQQIIVVQAREGSLWEGGAPVIIVHSTAQWKIWRGEEYVEDIPTTRNHVCCEMGPEQMTEVGAEGGNAQHVDRYAPRRTLGDRHRRQTDFAALGTSVSFHPSMKSQYWRRGSSPEGYTIGFKRQTSPLSSSIEALAGQQDGRHPLAGPDGTNTSVLKRRRRHSDSTDSDVPIAVRKRKLLWNKRDAKGRFTSDMDREHDDTRIQISPLGTTLVANSNGSPSTQGPPNLVGAVSKASSATTQSLVKLRKLSKEAFASPKSVGARIRAPEADNGLLTTTTIGDTTVSFVDAAGKKALDCLWGELEDTDDLFARARVSGIISKRSRLLEVGVGNEVVLVQKRFDKDFEELKMKMLKQEVRAIRVECGE